MKLFITIFAFSLLTSGCSKRIMEAMEPHKLHDEYIILRKNGHYSVKIMVLGAFRMPDNVRGRYLLSNDTVYFVDKDRKNVYKMYSYGIIDKHAETFTFRMSDTADWKTFDIRKMPVRREYKKKKEAATPQ
jgi:hypothetical protein